MEGRETSKYVVINWANILERAINSSHASVVREIFENYKHKVTINQYGNSLLSRGHNPLTTSAERGDVKTTTSLREEVSLDPNKRDERGLAPLHVAAKQGFLAILEELLDWKEVDVELKSTQGHPHMLAEIDTMATDECRRYGLPE